MFLIVYFQLSGKECAPSISSRHLGEGGGGAGGGNSGDRKKPFSRPFNKSRLEPSSSAGGTGRMSSPSPTDTSTLMRQNNELRQRLQEEASTYRRRLETYKQAQNNQAALVSRLQAKVLQYKQRCSELEQTPTSSTCPSYDVRDHSPGRHHAAPSAGPICSSVGAPMSLPPCPVARERSRSRSRSQSPCRKYADGSHDEVRHQLDEERRRYASELFDLRRPCVVITYDICPHRCEKLLVENSCLRQQLEESHRTNEALTNDLQKLTADWESLRDELLNKEDEWKEEEQVSDLITVTRTANCSF